MAKDKAERKMLEYLETWDNSPAALPSVQVGNAYLAGYQEGRRALAQELRETLESEALYVSAARQGVMNVACAMLGKIVGKLGEEK